jgi:peptidoglycan/xylan/chitin deacetylase (PgdA/CDA1 family)
MKGIVLSYHSHNVFGGGYENNDHVAFSRDLELITAAGGEIISLMSLVARIRRRQAVRAHNEEKIYIALTFDDGPLFDYKDFIHPVHGYQRSFYNEMMKFRAEHDTNVQPALSATSFVIASPSARQAMARSPECGYTFLNEDWLGDDWWESAAKTGMISIGNHSLDHVHPVVPSVVLSSEIRGSFHEVATYADASAQIRDASALILKKTNGLSVPLFAFPYGHYNDYLIREYLPNHIDEHGLAAAFSADGRYITDQDSLWCLPRFVCGLHWKSPEDLNGILNG